MADAELRRLERRALSTGGIEDFCRWVLHARRVGAEIEGVSELYCDNEGALEFIQQCIKSRAHRYHPDFYPVKVLQVLYAYHDIDEWTPNYRKMPVVEGESFGVIADVELETGEVVPVWAEDWWAVPDAPDATTHGNKIYRLDDVQRVMPYRWTLKSFAKESYPFGRARLEEILESFPD